MSAPESLGDSSRLDTAARERIAKAWGPAAVRLAGRIAAEQRRNERTIRSLETARRTLASRVDLRERLARMRRPSATRAALGSTLTIYSPFKVGENTAITGTLRKSSATTVVYVDDEVNGSVSDEEVNALHAAFDTITRPREHALFGTEADIDDNGAVILYLAGDNKFAENELGFFRPVDMLPDGVDPSLRSNEAEILYAVVPSAAGSAALENAILAHEFNHLINFSIKSLPSYEESNGTTIVQEQLWLAEGMAHLAEELTGWGIDTPQLTGIFLDCQRYTSVAGSGSSSTSIPKNCRVVGTGTDSLPRRGAANLLLLYMFQQLGGATYSTTSAGTISGDGIAFLEGLNTSASVGIANLEGSSGTAFFNWYAYWLGAIMLDGTERSTDERYAFDDVETDSFTGLIRGVRMRSERQDNKGDPVVLDGPVPITTQTVSGALTLSGSLYESGAAPIELVVPAHSALTLESPKNTALQLGVALARID